MPVQNPGVTSLFALHNLHKTERAMGVSIERLSSGKRINHAGDDAAGAATSIAKTVNKHNNGKLFRITRSFSTATVTAGTLATATTLTCASSSSCPIVTHFYPFSTKLRLGFGDN